jgi:hypothetical protein
MKFIIILCLLLSASPAIANETTNGPSYPWAAKKCILDKDKNIAARCYWVISSPDLKRQCIDQWKLKINNTWVQVLPMKCGLPQSKSVFPTKPSRIRRIGSNPKPDRIKTYKSKVP